MVDIFSMSSNFSLKVEKAEDYDPKITEEIDRKIRNMPMVRAYIKGKANQLKNSTGTPNFEVVMSENPDQSRPRAYVAPANREGIHQELSDAVLLKAALGMGGK